MKHILKTLALAIGLISGPALAETWTLDNAQSRLSYGTIKLQEVGEVNFFENLSGTVSADGKATIEIDLNSVQTDVDIRNQRMIDHVFKNAPTATLTAKLKMEELTALNVGETTTLYTRINMSLVGKKVRVPAQLFVARLAEDKVLVTTMDMVFLSTYDAGVNAGVDTLQKIAKLTDITRAVPITARFVFELDN